MAIHLVCHVLLYLNDPAGRTLKLIDLERSWTSVPQSTHHPFSSAFENDTSILMFIFSERTQTSDAFLEIANSSALLRIKEASQSSVEVFFFLTQKYKTLRRKIAADKLIS